MLCHLDSGPIPDASLNQTFSKGKNMYELIDCSRDAFLCRISDRVYQIDCDLPFAANNDEDAKSVFRKRMGRSNA